MTLLSFRRSGSRICGPRTRSSEQLRPVLAPRLFVPGLHHLGHLRSRSSSLEPNCRKRTKTKKSLVRDDLECCTYARLSRPATANRSCHASLHALSDTVKHPATDFDPNDQRSLYERLQEQKDAKQEEWEHKNQFKNQVRCPPFLEIPSSLNAYPTHSSDGPLAARRQ